LCFSFLSITLAFGSLGNVVAQGCSALSTVKESLQVLDKVYQASPTTVVQALKDKGEAVALKAHAAQNLCQIIRSEIGTPKCTFLELTRDMFAKIRDKLANPDYELLVSLRPLAQVDLELSLQHALREEMGGRFKASLVGYCFNKSGMEFGYSGKGDAQTAELYGNESQWHTKGRAPVGDEVKRLIQDAVREHSKSFINQLSGKKRYYPYVGGYERPKCPWKAAGNVEVPCSFAFDTGYEPVPIG